MNTGFSIFKPPRSKNIQYRSPEPVIVVRLTGGLGNQMFQYAAALALGRHWQCPVKVDIRAYKNNPKRLYLLDRFKHTPTIAGTRDIAIFSGVFAALKKHLLNLVPHCQTTCSSYRQPDNRYDANLIKLQPPLFLRKGYFQSEKFFLSCADTIRDAFQLKEPLPLKSQDFLSAIQSSPRPVAVHIRRGDYLGPARKTHPLCTHDYYEKAVGIINERSAKKATWFVFSDDIPAAQSLLSFLPNSIPITGHKNAPWIDMFLMAACRDSIIANSSFSWWGAWLNSNSDKVIVAPEFWFQKETNINTRDLIPPSWISLRV